MYSHCSREASEACLSGCCASPFLATNESSKSHQIEFEVASPYFLNPNTKFTNHESLPSLQNSFLEFIRAFPQYLQTEKADQIRAEEYHHLHESHRVYLNHIGHGLFSHSQLRLQLQRNRPESSRSRAYGASGSSLFDLSCKSETLSAELLFGSQDSKLQSKIRKRIMGFMNLLESDYSLVFTPSNSSAFKLLAEAYPFQSDTNLLTVYDYENEVVDCMIESSKKRGGRAESAEFLWPNLQIRSEKLRKKITRAKKKGKERGLFVFPSQSRVTGARYSYSWMSLARENGWHVLLDASSLGSKEMETLGLSLFKPDFLICFFFKVFGENSSGFSCLFIKKSSASVLREPVFHSNLNILVLETDKADSRIQQTAESTSVSMSIQENNENNLGLAETNAAAFSPKAASFSEIVELEPPVEHDPSDNTQNYTNSNHELEFRGLDHADTLGLVVIRLRGKYLTKWLIHALMSLQHPNSENENGIPLVRIYGPNVKFDGGPSIAFNLYDWQETKIDPFLVQKLAERNRIFLGCGILQNVWCADKKKIITGEAKDKKGRYFPSGLSVITVTLGFLTNFEDVYKVWAFFSRFLDADFLEKERWRRKALDQKGSFGSLIRKKS